MPASSPRPRALGTLVAGALFAGILGTTGAPAAAAPAVAPATAVSAAADSFFAGPPPETESAEHVHGDGHDHAPAPVRLSAAATRTAAAAATKVPAVPGGLPTALEPLSRYVAQADCDPATKPGAIKLGRLLTATYPNTSFGGGRACTDRAPSEHYDGRAVDWMNSIRNSTQKAQAAALLKWLFAKDAAGNTYANARRLGVMYIIWNNKIWGSYDTRWTAYSNCASTPAKSSDTVCHRDHMHISLSWEGAMGRTSFWTKKVAATDYGPCRPADLNWAPNYTKPNPGGCARYGKVAAPASAPAIRKRAVLFSGAQLSSGYTGQPVVALQNALKITATGTYDVKTATAVRNLQARNKLSVNGIMNAGTWRALLAESAGPPKVTARLRTFNADTGVWTTSGGSTSTWGQRGDVPFVGDFQGDGVLDRGVYRPSTKEFRITGSDTVAFGSAGDIPVPGRYSSATRSDIALYRPGTGAWYIRGVRSLVLGGGPGDIPVPADYDGDGLVEPAVYTPSTATWTIEGQEPYRWGNRTDIPVPADYNGDGKAEIGVYRPSAHQWRIVGATNVVFGKPGDVPAPMQYDDGDSAERAIWRPSTGEWHVLFGKDTVVVKSKVRGASEVPASG